MQNAMAVHTRAEEFPLYRMAPLFFKWAVVRLIHQIMGESNSCISLSNLGVVTMPKEMNQYVKGIDFILTPKVKSSYNCGVVSFDNKISISFSRSCVTSELEDVFFEKLQQMVQIDGTEL